MSGSYVRTNCC